MQSTNPPSPITPSVAIHVYVRTYTRARIHGSETFMQVSDIRNRVSPHTAEAWQSIKDSWPLNDTVPTLRVVYRRILPEPGETRHGLPWLAAVICGVWRAVVFTASHLIMQA